MMSLKSCLLNWHTLQETERAYLFWDTLTIKFRTMPMPPIVMISSPSSAPMQSHISCIMPNHCSKPHFIKMPKKLFNKLKAKNTLTECSNCRLLSNMSQKRFHMPNPCCPRCQRTPPRPLSLKVACSTRKRNLMKQEISSKRPSTCADINAILLITLLYVSIS